MAFDKSSAAALAAVNFLSAFSLVCLLRGSRGGNSKPTLPLAVSSTRKASKARWVRWETKPVISSLLPSASTCASCSRVISLPRMVRDMEKPLPLLRANSGMLHCLSVSCTSSSPWPFTGMVPREMGRIRPFTAPATIL